MKKFITLVLLVLVSCLTGCVSQRAAAQFAEFEKLGITKATITGKFSNTDYSVVKDNGVRKAVLDHSDTWLPKVHIERETPLPSP